VKRESTALDGYVKDSSCVRSVIPKDKKSNTDGELYPAVVTDVNKIGKRVKIHYAGHTCSERYEWRPCDTVDSSPPFQQTEALHVTPSTPLGDRTELVHGELYREIKRKLYSGRKDDTATCVEI